MPGFEPRSWYKADSIPMCYRALVQILNLQKLFFLQKLPFWTISKIYYLFKMSKLFKFYRFKVLESKYCLNLNIIKSNLSLQNCRFSTLTFYWDKYKNLNYPKKCECEHTHTHTPAWINAQHIKGKHHNIVNCKNAQIFPTFLATCQQIWIWGLRKKWQQKNFLLTSNLVFFLSSRWVHNF